jgi:hypothetical protein
MCEVNAVAATDIRHHLVTRQRKMGPIGTAARLVVGSALLGSVA